MLEVERSKKSQDCGAQTTLYHTTKLMTTVMNKRETRKMSPGRECEGWYGARMAET